jgi:hypothetical protein
VVVFQRYAEGSNPRLAINASSVIRGLFGDNVETGFLTEERLEFILGQVNYNEEVQNIGHRLGRFAELTSTVSTS